MGLLSNLFGPDLPPDTQKLVEQNTSLQKRLDAVAAINKAIVGVVDQKKVLDMITSSLVSVVGVSYATVFVWDEDETALSVGSITIPKTVSLVSEKALGNPIKTFKLSAKNPDHKDNDYIKAIVEGRTIETKDLHNLSKPFIDKGAAGVIQRLLGMKIAVTIPLTVQDKKLGVLGIIWHENTFTTEDKMVIDTFTSQVSTTLYNSQLFEKVNAQVSLLELQNRDLQSLFNLTSRISQSLNPQEVAQTAVDSLPQDDMMLGGAVSTYNPKTKLLTVAAAANSPVYQKVLELIGGEIHIDVPIYTEAYKGGIVRKVMDTKRPQFTDDMETFFTPGLPKAVVPILVKLLQIESVAVFPLLANGEITGIVSYFLKTKSKEGAADRRLQLLQTYTLQIASALENSNLFQDLQKAIEQLKEAHRRERDMMDVMGHELRTPIAIVRNAIMMLDRSYVKHAGTVAPAEMRKYLDMAIESVRREISLIETLLSATKIDASRMQLALTKVDFKDVVNDALEGQRGLVVQKNLSIEVVLPKEDVFVFADRVSAQEIMDNFYSNAVKYTDTGTIRLTMWTDPETKLAWVQIKDSGIGIAEEDLSHLGKKFFRANQYIPTNDPSTSKFIRPGGTGLGLYVAFNLVGVMGGKLYINSQVGKGSTFTFSMPMYTDQADTAIGAIFPNGNTNRDHVILNGDAPQPPA